MARLGLGTGSEIVIGVVGPLDLVERIMFMGREPGTRDWRLVGSAHNAEQETRERLMKIVDGIDVALFTGPLQYDLARAEGELPVPATYVPVSGASMYSALLGGTVAGTCDPARVSVDSIAEADVKESYDEMNVSTAGVHVLEYQGPTSVKEFLAFHERLYRSGKTSAALTTVRTVAQGLQAAGVPALRMLPTARTLRTALNTAALLGTGSKLEESQIAIAIVQLPQAYRQGHIGPSNYWQQELRLSLHRTLLIEAQRMGATVMPWAEHSYLIVATVGSLAQATDGLRAAPFLDSIREELGATVEIGIGLGRSARDAEVNAATAVGQASATEAVLIDANGDVMSLPARPHQRQADPAAATVTASSARSKGVQVLGKLIDRLGVDGGSGPEVVDAEAVSELLGISARSARRTLNELVEQGLAWPVPVARSAQVGRPRQQYRLVAEKLGR
ncbi:hypothetical protein HDA40_007959 [Hamadaea flava]|uniref:Transcriptional regulator n=1 Tax=Hamadaea flava TaxID=1742688 RepID=A0ABV8LF19_9ACTN|nr:hypothetical protein [Hamadaea flava]MCP2329452.1 hypothetical protein [Hamadaea flava]